MKKALICLLLAGLLVCGVSCEFGNQAETDNGKSTESTELTEDKGTATDTDAAERGNKTDDMQGPVPQDTGSGEATAQKETETSPRQEPDTTETTAKKEPETSPSQEPEWTKNY